MHLGQRRGDRADVDLCLQLHGQFFVVVGQPDPDAVALVAEGGVAAGVGADIVALDQLVAASDVE